jgi:hypothetical protein
MGTQNWDGLALDGRDSISGYRLTQARTLAHEGNIFRVTGGGLGATSLQADAADHVLHVLAVAVIHPGSHEIVGTVPGVAGAPPLREYATTT